MQYVIGYWDLLFSKLFSMSHLLSVLEGSTSE